MQAELRKKDYDRAQFYLGQVELLDMLFKSEDGIKELFKEVGDV